MKKIAIFSLSAFLFFGTFGCAEETTENTTDPAASATTTTTDVAPTPVAEPELPATTAEFSTMKHDFGKIKAGEKVEHSFSFKNTGNNPLKISNVKPSCGCTTPDWTKEEVAPGQSGFIKVEFDSKGKTGVQNKTVTVTLNTEEKTQVLSFTGEIVGEEAPAK